MKKGDMINNGSCEQALFELTTVLERDEGNADLVSELISKYPECADEITSNYNLWNDLGDFEVPEPSAVMHARFYKSLSELSQPAQPSGLASALESISIWLQNLSAPVRWGLVASVFVLGMITGSNFFPSVGSLTVAINEENPIDYLTYTNTTRRISATDKLVAMREIKDGQKPDDRILQALYQAVLNDPNINVRLTAIETLIFFADQPQVRELLIKAIPIQESPLVQIALANAMLFLEEKRSGDAWKELFESGEVEADVKMHLEKTLETLL